MRELVQDYAGGPWFLATPFDFTDHILVNEKNLQRHIDELDTELRLAFKVRDELKNKVENEPTS